MTAINYEDKFWALIYDQYNTGRHEKELVFYLDELKDCKGPVLEVACGTGMILFKMLEKGLDIYGFDISEEMLQVLYSKAKVEGYSEIRDRVSKQNMLNFHYDKQFDAIFIPARSFLHLTTQEKQIACLRNIFAHLKQRGRLLLNFFNPNLECLLVHSAPSSDYEHFDTFTDPHTKEPIEVFFKQQNDISKQVQNITWKFVTKDSERETKMYLRWIYKEEFQLLLRVAGFRDWTLYGDFDKSAYCRESNELIWVVEKW